MIDVTDMSKCTRTRILPDGNTEVSCIKGLWSVDALDDGTARSIAEHYFYQYQSAGEYADILGGPTMVEVLKETRNEQ